MPKRFTDTEKWKKPFIRGLQGAYKLLWFYILDDCDHAGIWQVDFEVARIRTGEQLDYDTALSLFKDRVEVIDKFKWFVPDFISFQYGELKDNNRMHLSVIQILTKYKVGPYKPLPRGQGQGTIQGQGYGQGQGIPATDEKTKPELQDYEVWTEQILEQQDAEFEVMFMNERIPPGEHVPEYVKDHRDLLSRYPKMRPPDQHSFRRSCIKHIKDKIREQPKIKAPPKKLTLKDLEP